MVVGLAPLSSHTSAQNTGRQTIRSEVNPKGHRPKMESCRPAFRTLRQPPQRPSIINQALMWCRRLSVVSCNGQAMLFAEGLRCKLKGVNLAAQRQIVKSRSLLWPSLPFVVLFAASVVGCSFGSPSATNVDFIGEVVSADVTDWSVKADPPEIAFRPVESTAVCASARRHSTSQMGPRSTCPPIHPAATSAACSATETNLGHPRASWLAKLTPLAPQSGFRFNPWTDPLTAPPNSPSTGLTDETQSC